MAEAEFPEVKYYVLQACGAVGGKFTHIIEYSSGTAVS
jgi:hypothetical protein